MPYMYINCLLSENKRSFNDIFHAGNKHYTIRSLVVNYRVSLKSSSMSHFEGRFRLCFPLVSKKKTIV